METGQIICNQCGKILVMENGILREDAFFATKEWGYFSKRDLEIDHFVICEDCYNEWIKNFKKPVVTTTKKEILSPGQM